MDTVNNPAANAVSAVVRVERGRIGDEELAAVTALLLARAAARPRPADRRPRRTTASWRRLERTTGYRAPHSWQH